MTNHTEVQIEPLANATDIWENQGGSAVSRLARFAVDDSPHSSDGLLLHGWDGPEQVTAFISRRVMDNWVDPRRSLAKVCPALPLGNRNLLAIERIATFKYQRGPAFNRQHPFVDILLSDITESGEVLDVSQLV